jgi:biopolymer transport protein ExbD
VENRRYTLAEFKILLHNRVSANARLPVYVKPHGKTPHGVVVSLIDGIRAAGIQKISVAIGDEGLKQE